MTDNVAVLDGFTKELMAYSSDVDMLILVKPDTDLDSRFKAWDSDNQEYVLINGWLFTFEAIINHAPSHTAITLRRAIQHRDAAVKYSPKPGFVNLWHEWDDEARYLAGVIISGSDCVPLGWDKV